MALVWLALLLPFRSPQKCHLRETFLLYRIAPALTDGPPCSVLLHSIYHYLTSHVFCPISCFLSVLRVRLLMLCSMLAQSCFSIKYLLSKLFWNPDCQFCLIVTLTKSCFWLNYLQQVKPHAKIFPNVSGFNPHDCPRRGYYSCIYSAGEVTRAQRS